MNAEQELFFLTGILNALADPVFVKDEAHRWVAFNDAFCRMLGHSREELLGRSDYDFSPPEEARVFWEKDALVLASGEENLNIERHSARGVTRILSTKKTRLTTASGQHYLVGVIRDITESKRAEDELREAKEAAEAADRAKSLFLANVSHELRTPLNALVGLTELLLEDEPRPNQLEHLYAIRESGAIQATLIEDLLTLARCEGGVLEVEPRSFRLRAWLRRALTLFRQRADQRGPALSSHVDEGVPEWIEADPVRLGQILGNLLDNALKFSDGAVRVQLWCEGESSKLRLKLQVADEGPGIPPAAAAQLFQPFSRGDLSPARRQGGLGLGLSISRRVAERLEGTLELEDSGPGAGASFLLEIPVALGVEAEERPEPPEVPGLEALRLLVAGEDRFSLHLLEAFLERLGARAELVRDGESALARILEGSIDLALIEVTLPGLDGHELARRVRAERNAGAPVKLIGLTASGRAPELLACREAGMDAVLTKPIGLDELREVLIQVLR